MRQKPSSREQRSGFTLFELLIALSILVILLSIVVPSISRLMGQQKFLDQTGQVVTFLNDTRRQAVEEASAYEVYYISGGEIIISAPAKATYTRSHELPETISFSEVETPLRLEEITLETAPADWLTKGWSPPILFRADGTSTDHEFQIEDEAGRSKRIRIRGLTGQITIENG